MTEIIHKPVLLRESIEGLNLKKGDTVVDATLGGGGHALEILKKIGPSGKLIAIDVDGQAINNFKKKFQSEAGNVDLVKGNFSDIKNILGGMNVLAVDGMLADLGYSSIQLEDESYGMSFLQDAELDMRLSLRNTNSYECTNNLSAKDIVNKYPAGELSRILCEYGEEKFANSIAKRIVEARKIKSIERTLELVEIIKNAIPERYQHGKTHPATKTFQALRIEVNQELENLKKFIPQAIEALSPGGRLAIISFHSLEDRIVKNMFRENARGCICPPETQLQLLQEEYIRAVEQNDSSADELERMLRTGKPDFPKCLCGHKAKISLINKKPIVPSGEEILENPRARSAKLRVCERL
jgi:16S rRNA (cytosine1402-N4)-methyltransferase